jgi:hypothetical protein
MKIQTVTVGSYCRADVYTCALKGIDIIVCSELQTPSVFFHYIESARDQAW